MSHASTRGTLRALAAMSACGLVAMVAVGAAAPGLASHGALTAPMPTLVVRAVDPCVAGVLGDVTGDGLANVIDAQQVARASVGLPVNATVASRLASHGDVTGDGNANVIDAQQIARSSAGLNVAFPVGEPMCGIEVTTATAGNDIDPNGYDVLLDGGVAATVAVSGAVDLTELAAGDYTVALSDVASNCSVTNGPESRDVSVTEGVAASVAFELSCVATSETIGDLEVRNTTDGTNQPAGSYTISLDGGAAETLPVDGAFTFEDVTSGNHTLVIGNVPGNCTVSGGATQDITIPKGTSFSQHSFAINCS